MTLTDLIKSYHARKTCPIFVFPSSDVLFKSQIEGYSIESSPALERFALDSGFRLVRQDHGSRLKFIPEHEPEDYEEWTEVVAFDRSTLKA